MEPRALMPLVLTCMSVSGCLSGGGTDPTGPVRCEGLRAAEPGEADGDADLDCDLGVADAGSDAEPDLDGDAGSDPETDLPQCAPGDAANVIVNACHGDILTTGPRDDLGLACDEMVGCRDDDDCTLVVIDRCCALEVASVPVGLEDDLIARTPECSEAPPECERCLPLFSLAPTCARGICSMRFLTGEDR